MPDAPGLGIDLDSNELKNRPYSPLPGKGLRDYREEFPRKVAAVAPNVFNPAATAHEAFGRRGAVDSAIKPIYPGLRVLGFAFTVKISAGDNFTIHAALELAKPGDVLVIDAGDYTEQGSFGDVMATAALSRSIAGLVTNGGVRDAERIHKLGFPMFSRAISI